MQPDSPAGDDELAATSRDGSPLEATPLEATPLEATPLEATPLEAMVLAARLWRRRLPTEFFARDALVVARELVGAYLVHAPKPEGPLVVRLVETEAYRGPTDAACHARVGLTSRTRTLFGPPGHAYVFLIYGMYDCFNVVACAEGAGHAVLVRAAEPVAGELYTPRCDGPGRLTRALGLTRGHDGASLRSRSLFLAPADALQATAPVLATSARVNVAYAGAIAEEPWRFYDAASRHVSRVPARSLGLGGELGPPRPRARVKKTSAEGTSTKAQRPGR